MRYRLLTSKEKILWIIRIFFGSLSAPLTGIANWATDKLNKSYYKFLNNANSLKDSGYCGGCGYVKNNLKSFLTTFHKQILEEAEKDKHEHGLDQYAMGQSEGIEYGEQKAKKEMVEEELQELKQCPQCHTMKHMTGKLCFRCRDRNDIRSEILEADIKMMEGLEEKI